MITIGSDNIKTILINFKLDNWNKTIGKNRANKYVAANYKKKEMNKIEKYLQGVDKITKYPIQIYCEWHVRYLTSDLDNMSLKSVLDQMQISGILENDNCKHINKIIHTAVKDTSDYLLMYIKEDNDDVRTSTNGT